MAEQLGSRRVSTCIEIERLVIDGLPLTPRDGRVVAAALEARLTMLLRKPPEGSSLSSSAAIPRLDAGVLAVDRHVSPAQLGRQVAVAVHRAIAGPGPTESLR
jgi:hypothetical protein